jgi:hypothetical protein
MKNMRDEKFHTSKPVSLLFDFQDYYNDELFSEVANYFYNTFLLYLGKCSNNPKLL